MFSRRAKSPPRLLKAPVANAHGVIVPVAVVADVVEMVVVVVEANAAVVSVVPGRQQPNQHQQLLKSKLSFHFQF